MSITLSDYALECLFSGVECKNKSERIERLILIGLESEINNDLSLKSKLLDANSRLRSLREEVNQLKLLNGKLKATINEKKEKPLKIYDVEYS